MTRIFNYFEVSPALWADRLRAFKDLDSSPIKIPCLWGAHEQTKGIRDFSRSPKQRLEKLFSEAKSCQVSLDLCFGFSPHELTFPKWTLGEKKKGLSPAVLWNEQDRGYEFHSIPSFVDPDFQTGFLEFLEEALNLASLYVGEGGPIAGVSIDLGVLESDLALATSEPYLELFKAKYRTAESLNEKFSTSYRSLSGTDPNQLFRFLFERRPWLTAYDYRLFRSELLGKFKTKIQGLSSVQLLGEKVSVDSSRPANSQTVERLFVIDSTFVDLNTDTVAPFFPETVVNPMSAFAYRIAEYCSGFARTENYGFVGVSENRLSPSLKSPFIIAVSGKYMSTAGTHFLEESAKQGASVFFPFGFPVYGEGASEAQSVHLGQRETVKTKSKPLLKRKIGQGGFYCPLGSLPMDESLAVTFKEYEELIQRGD